MSLNVQAAQDLLSLDEYYDILVQQRVDLDMLDDLSLPGEWKQCEDQYAEALRIIKDMRLKGILPTDVFTEEDTEKLIESLDDAKELCSYGEFPLGKIQEAVDFLDDVNEEYERFLGVLAPTGE